jgi:hypothetical protein
MLLHGGKSNPRAQRHFTTPLRADNVAAVGGDLRLYNVVPHDIAKPATAATPQSGLDRSATRTAGALGAGHFHGAKNCRWSEEMRMVQKLVKLHLRPIALVKETVTDLAVRAPAL